MPTCLQCHGYSQNFDLNLFVRFLCRSQSLQEFHTNSQATCAINACNSHTYVSHGHTVFLLFDSGSNPSLRWPSFRHSLATVLKNMTFQTGFIVLSQTQIQLLLLITVLFLVAYWKGTRIHHREICMSTATRHPAFIH